VSNSGYVVVADRVRQTLVFLRFDRHSLTHVRDIPLTWIPTDICFYRSEVFLSGGGPVFHSIALEGNAVKKIECPPDSREENPLARGMFSEGLLVCPGRGRLGLWGRRFTGTITVWDTERGNAGRLILPDFQAVDTSTAGVGFRQKVEEHGLSLVSGLGWLSDTNFFAQVVDIARDGQGKGQRRRVRTFIIGPEGSFESWIGWPPLKILRYPFAVEVSSDFLPTVRVLRIEPEVEGRWRQNRDGTRSHLRAPGCDPSATSGRLEPEPPQLAASTFPALHAQVAFGRPDGRIHDW
jgi:hypothetical protein